MEKALSDFKGTAEFSISVSNDGGNSSNTLFNERVDDHYKVVTVDTITIDSFVEENKIKKIDFIKADVEGAERYLLMGAKNILQKFAPKLSICTYHLSDDPQVLEEIILSANPNYIIKHKWQKLYAYVLQDGPKKSIG